MNLITNVYHLILYQPLFNSLIIIYEYLPGHDFGMAVIILTILIRIILYPLMMQSIRSQKVLSELQPKIQEIQEKFKNDKEKQAKELIELYQKEKINPFTGLFSLFIQIPILIALYQVFWKGLQLESMSSLYNFVPNPGPINPYFLNLINLSQPNLVLAILSGISQFFQTKMMVSSQKIRGNRHKKEGFGQVDMAQFSEIMQKETLYFFPILTVFILLKMPAALSLYWIVTTLFSIGQQAIISKKPTYAQPD